MIIGSNGAIYRQRRHALELAYGHAEVQVPAHGASSAGDYVSVQASGNGGATWTEVGRISGPANDSHFVTKSYNITAYSGRNTAIRFVALDERVASATTTSTSTTSRSTTPRTSATATRCRSTSTRPPCTPPGIKGSDVGVAVIDTGYWKLDSLDHDSHGNGRVAAQYDAITQHVVQQLGADLDRHHRPRHARHQPDRQQPQERAAARTSASRRTRASSPSRRSVKTARAATPP